MQYGIRIEGLKKKFEERRVTTWALKGIDLRIRKNQIFGLLGPNGAGKTTTIYILSTLLLPTSGKAEVLGYDVVKDYYKIRENIGFCISGTKFYWELTAKEILEYYGRLCGLDSVTRKKTIMDLIGRLGIEPFKNKQFHTLSTGMMQKLALAKSLLNEPEVLFLDEPTAGLDVEVAIKIRDFIMDIQKEREMTILVTSHQLYEVEEMCKKIAIINKGRLVIEGGINTIRKRIGFPDVIRLYIDRYGNMDFLKNIEGVLDYEVKDGLFIEVTSGADVISKVMKALKTRKIKILDIEMRKARLQDIFLKVVGGKHA